MRVFVLGSGSSGNALLVEAAGTRILIDGGIGPRAAAARLALLGSELLPRGVDAIVATHHHGDHFGQIEKLARALRVPVYLHAGIEAPRVRRKCEVREYGVGAPFRLGPLELHAEAVPHDAPQVALRVACPNHALGIVTDLGTVPRSVVALLGACDAALVEANHCPDMLATGPYPLHLKRRVAGNFGHLSNEQTAELASRLQGTRLGRLWLCHLSRTNNTPERALAVVGERAGTIAVAAIPHGSSHALDVARARPVQLALPF